jgi:hypothetical protein
VTNALYKKPNTYFSPLVFHPDFASESRKALDSMTNFKISNRSLTIVQADNEFEQIMEKSNHLLTVDVLARAWHFQRICYKRIAEDEESALTMEEVNRLEEAFEFLRNGFQEDPLRDQNGPTWVEAWMDVMRQ